MLIKSHHINDLIIAQGEVTQRTADENHRKSQEHLSFPRSSSLMMIKRRSLSFSPVKCQVTRVRSGAVKTGSCTRQMFEHVWIIDLIEWRETTLKLKKIGKGRKREKNFFPPVFSFSFNPKRTSDILLRMDNQSDISSVAREFLSVCSLDQSIDR